MNSKYGAFIKVCYLYIEVFFGDTNVKGAIEDLNAQLPKNGIQVLRNGLGWRVSVSPVWDIKDVAREIVRILVQREITDIRVEHQNEHGGLTVNPKQ